MQEIEVKARVQDIDRLRSAITNLGISLNDPIFQYDVIYTEGNWETIKSKNDRNILRIRKQNDRAILTLKRPGINELHSQEHETEVINTEEMHSILLLMGYQPIVEVKKNRQKAHYQDMEICLDQVEGLGWFIEVEKLLHSSNKVEEVQEELFKFLESLGVKREDREERGYDTLVRLKEENK